MSRIGKLPIAIPDGVKVSVRDGVVFVEGPKGKLEQKILPGLTVEMADGKLVVRKTAEDRQTRSNYGTLRSLLYNMVQGVSQGFKKELDIVGVGYKAQVSGKTLELSLGYSHPIKYAIPDGIKIEVAERNTRIIVSGHDKRQVGFVAASIREFRPPEPYKGKGIKYVDERIRRKVGKAAVGSGG